MRAEAASIRAKKYLRLFLSVVILLCTLGLGVIAWVDDAHCAIVTLSWDPSPDSAVQGYIIHYGTASGNYTQHTDVGDVTTWTLSGLQDGVTYYIAVTAYDRPRNESGYSNEVVYPPAGTESSSGGGCFIATTAFGPTAPEVATLRAFRDSWLLTNRPGRMLTAFYYRISPPIADLIGRDEKLKQLVRMTLMPFVYGAKYPAATICLMGFPLLVGVLYKANRKIRWLHRFRSHE